MRAASPIVLVGERLPVGLSDLPEPPAALFVRGELPRGPSVAIVGTRTPTREALGFTRELARELSAAGVSVLSGGALGIDTAAHEGALRGGSPTVVVAPAGYAAPYPAENAALFRRIVARGGAYVALVPDDALATQAAFFPRNACLVALAHAVVIVQARCRSGARNAAAQARQLGRPLLAVPSSPWIREGAGCLLELRRGARPCERSRDVLDLLDRSGLARVAPRPAVRPRARRPARLPARAAASDSLGAADSSANISEALPSHADEARVLAAVRSGLRHVDELCIELGLPAARLNAVLLTLELQGFLVCRPPGWVETSKSLD